jgi:hypothetical protein
MNSTNEKLPYALVSGIVSDKVPCIVCSEEKTNLPCYCDSNCCSSCFQQWILSNPDKDPICVNCQRVVPQDTLYDNLDPSFLKKEYRIWRSTFLFLKEKPYFIDDMGDVVQELKRRKQVHSLQQLYNERKKLKRKKTTPQSRVLVEELEKKIREFKETIPRSIFYRKTIEERTSRNKTKTMVIPCSHEECRGYILHPEYECALCESRVCKECLEILIDKDKEHKCQKETRISAQKILHETRACPQCAVRIYQISGCDQMWCVCCHCTFSWETGKKLVETTHNPHYYEWLFSRQRTETNETNAEQNNIIPNNIHNNILCPNQGQQYNQYIEYIRNQLYRMNDLPVTIYWKFSEIIRWVVHIQYIVLPDFQVDRLKTNKDLRFKYLLKEMEEEDVERILYKREKKQMKKEAIYDILGVIINSIFDILYRFTSDPSSNSTFQVYITEINTFLEHIRDMLDNIQSRYGGKTLVIPYFD